MQHPSRIAIVGGGPAGLALARILHVRGIASMVFERDAHALDRPQGGSLDLHEESGQLALERAGLTHAFRRVARYDDQGDRLLDHTGTVHFEQRNPESGNRPEIDRSALRDLLLNALPDGCVRWGHSVQDIRAQGDRFTVTANGMDQGTFDLVGGADGTWSRVRPLVSTYVPQYSGLTFVEFGIDDIDRHHPALSMLVGRGKVGIHGSGRQIIALRNGNDHVRAYAIFRVPAQWAASRFDWQSPSTVRAGLLCEFADFADGITDLIRAANDSFVARAIHALPVGHHWNHRPGVTLIGDAAHVMSPFGGEGVNAALLDATRLAQALSQDADGDTSHVAAFENDMFERVREAASESADAAATALSHDSLAITLTMHRERDAAQWTQPARQ